MKKLILVFTLLTIIAIGNIKSQDFEGGIIYGLITESLEGQFVEYANISVYLAKDSSLINGTISDASGRFFVQKLPKDSLYIEVEFVGFKKYVSDIFVLTEQVPYFGFENIVIEPNVNVLGEVNIEAEVKHVEYQIDKKIINPTKDILASGGTAVDVLKNVPSIQTDIDGNVSIRGNSGFKLLIDGRPSVIEGSDGLKQIPAESIERIEIITNPSARYDADGVAGIINVIMKEDKREGINGLISLNGGKVLDTYNTSDNFIINFRRKKFNFFVGADYRYYNHPGSGTTNQLTTLSDSLISIDSEFESLWRNQNYNFRAGSDLSLTDKDILTVSASIGEWGHGNENTSANTYSTLATDESTLNAYSYDQSSGLDLKNRYYSGHLNYQHKFPKEGHEINILSSFNGGQFDRSSTYFVDYDNSFNGSVANYGNYAFENDINFHGEAELNYINPIFGGKLEAGYKYRLVNSDGTYDYYNIMSEDVNDREIDSTMLNPLKSYENIQSLYSTFSGELLKIGYKLGLRMEYTDRQYIKKIDNTQFGNEEISLFPTVHLSRAFKEKHQIFTSYSRRINRPQPWFLDPQTTITGLYSVRQGNPELKSEFTDSYELGYSVFSGMNYFSFEAFYKQTNNKISHVISLADTSNVVTLTTFDNLDRDYAAGLEAMINVKLFKAISFATGGSFYHYALFGGDNGEISKKTFNYNAWLNVSYTYPKTKTKLQVSGYFSGPRVDLYTSSESFYTISAALKQDFMKNKLSVTFGCDNIVNSPYWVSETFNNNFFSRTDYLISGFRLKLGLTYRINDYKPRKDIQDDNVQQGGGMNMM